MKSPHIILLLIYAIHTTFNNRSDDTVSLNMHAMNSEMTTYFSKQCNKSRSILLLEGGRKNAAILFNTI